MRILCTGNPARQTLAWAAKHKWPDSKFMSLSNGWDLKSTDVTHIERFKKEIINYDVFINSSYIGPGSQEKLLQTVISQWMQADIKGHVFNIGTTLEWTNDSTDYVRSKIALRNASLRYNEQTGVTGVKCSYILLGGVNNQLSDCEDFVSPSRIMDAIEWIYQSSLRIGLLQIDSEK